MKLVTGNPGRRPLRIGEPHPGGPIERPSKLRGNAAKLWDRYIARAFWLTWADGPKALMWAHLQAEYERRPSEMIASRIAQLRALGSELGFDNGSRSRMGVTLNTGAPAPARDPADKYFGRR